MERDFHDCLNYFLCEVMTQIHKNYSSQGLLPLAGYTERLRLKEVPFWGCQRLAEKTMRNP